MTSSKFHRIFPVCSFILVVFELFCANSIFAVNSTLLVYPNLPNETIFEKTTASRLRITFLAWNAGDAPCVDELAILCGDEEASTNFAAASDVETTASSCIEGYPIHKIAHLNDGRFGNGASWIARPGDAKPSIAFAWPTPQTFDRIVFSRDRESRFLDRVPTRWEIAVSDDGENWRVLWTNSEPAFVVEPIIRADATSDWFRAGIAPDEPCELRPTTDENANSDAPKLSAYENQVCDGFLFEEIAWLKAAGFGDVETRLRQRNYPEHVEPQIPTENVLPLPILTDNSANLDDESVWNRAVRGTVSNVAAVDRWDAGPIFAQTLDAAVVGDEIFLQIRGDRFLSRRLAFVSVENAPFRGFIVLKDDDSLVWKRIDATPFGPSGEEVPAQGTFDRSTATARVRLPAAWFPEFEKRGLTVALGIGGRWTAPGGRPIRLVAADFAIRDLSPKSDGAFRVALTATGSNSVALELFSKKEPVGTLENVAADFREKIALAPGETQTIALPAQMGLVGPEFRLGVVDATGASFEDVLFRYDPTRRPLDLAREIVERQTATDADAADRWYFEKFVAIPGAVNPLYVDVDAERDRLVREARRREFQPLASASNELRAFAERLAEFERERQEIAENPQLAENSLLKIEKERDLYYRIKLAKRNYFLTNDEFAPLTKILFNKRNPFHPSHNYSDLFDSVWRPGGAVATLTIPQRENGRLEPENATVEELVSAGGGVIRNPSPSFDATKIYFALRVNQAEYFRVFEYDFASKTSRRISPDGPFHDFWPIELPDGAIAFISTRCKKKFICWRPQAFVLHRMEKDGSNLRELSHANLSEFAPSVKDDGRLIWTRSEYVDKGADYGHTLWTIRIDGTNPELVFGNTINLPQGYANGRDVPETGEVCAIAISHFGDLNGPLLFLDVAKGGREPAAIRTPTPEVPWPGAWAANETFREPFPITKDVVLVSWANRDRFGIWLVDRFGNREFLYADPAIDSVCAQPLRSRDVPPIRVGAIDPQLAAQDLGRFTIENVYRGLEGQVAPGAAKYLRICREISAKLDRNDDGTYRADHDPFEEWYASPTDVFRGAFGWPSYVAKGVVGTVEIEPDGSAEFFAPANAVLFFELLDENYNEIQRMRSVVQLQSGEQRSCVGCHESRFLAPNGAATDASRKPTARPTPPPWGAGPFYYEKVVQPVLDRNCVSCHSPQNAAKNPKQYDLTATTDDAKIPRSYRSLLASGTVCYFDYLWGGGLTTKAEPYSFGVAKSSLFQIIQDENHRSVALSSEELQALKCWIDLNVPLWGDYVQRRERLGTPRAD